MAFPNQPPTLPTTAQPGGQPPDPGAPALRVTPMVRPAVPTAEPTPQPAAPAAIPIPRPAVPSAGTPQPQQAAPAAQTQTGGFLNRLWPFGRPAPPAARPGQPEARPAGPAAIPAQITATLMFVAPTRTDAKAPLKGATVLVNGVGHETETDDNGRWSRQIATGGKPVRLAITPDDHFGWSKELRANATEMITLRQKPHAGLVAGLLGAAVLVSIVMVLSRFVPKVGQFQPPQIGQLNPLDWSSTPWIGPVQWMAVALLLTKGVFAFAEARERKQLVDAAAAFAAWALVVGAGHVMTIFKGGDNPMLAGIPVTAAFVIVGVAALLGGVDLSVVGTFFSALGDAVLIWGSLGSIGILFGIPDGAVYPWTDYSALFSLKQYQMLKITNAVFVYYGLAVVVYGMDVWKPWLKKYDIPALGLVVGLSMVPAYILIRTQTDVHPGWAALSVAVAAFVVANLTQHIGGGAVSRAPEDWSPWSFFGVVMRSPWDAGLIGLTIGALTLLLTGTV